MRERCLCQQSCRANSGGARTSLIVPISRKVTDVTVTLDVDHSFEQKLKKMHLAFRFMHPETLELIGEIS